MTELHFWLNCPFKLCEKLFKKWFGEYSTYYIKGCVCFASSLGQVSWFQWGTPMWKMYDVLYMTCRASASAIAAGPACRSEPTPHFTAREGILSPRTNPGQPFRKHTHTCVHTCLQIHPSPRKPPQASVPSQRQFWLEC